MRSISKKETAAQGAGEGSASGFRAFFKRALGSNKKAPAGRMAIGDGLFGMAMERMAGEGSLQERGADAIRMLHGALKEYKAVYIIANQASYDNAPQDESERKDTLKLVQGARAGRASCHLELGRIHERMGETGMARIQYNKVEEIALGAVFLNINNAGDRKTKEAAHEAAAAIERLGRI